MKLEVARPLGTLFVAVATFLICVPLLNVGLQVIPWRPAGQDWRFGAWGFLLGAMTFPTIGLGLLGVAGVLRDSTSLLRLALIGATIFGLAAAVGALDFVVAGTALKHKATGAQILALYDQEIRRTALVAVLAVPALAAVGVASYKLLKGLRSSESQQPGLHPTVRHNAG